MTAKLHCGREEDRLFEVCDQEVLSQLGQDPPDVNFVLGYQLLIRHSREPLRTDEDIIEIRIRDVTDVTKHPLDHSRNMAGPFSTPWGEHTPLHEPQKGQHTSQWTA